MEHAICKVDTTVPLEEPGLGSTIVLLLSCVKIQQQQKEGTHGSSNVAAVNGPGYRFSERARRFVYSPPETSCFSSSLTRESVYLAAITYSRTL